MTPASLSARFRTAFLIVAIPVSLSLVASAQTYVTPTTNIPPHYGPWNAIFLQGGIGLTYPLEQHDTVQMASSPWTLYTWIKPRLPLTDPTIIGGLGSTSDEYARMLAVSSSQVILWDGSNNSLRFQVPTGDTIAPEMWHFIAATYDGSTFRVYFDGSLIGSGNLLLGSVSPQISLAPSNNLPAGFEHYGGMVEGFTLLRHALGTKELAALSHRRKDLDIVDFAHGSKDWPIQARQWTGYREPQRPDQVPHSKMPFSKPVAQPLPAHRPQLTPDGSDAWTIGDWYLQAAPEVDATAAQIDTPDFSTSQWLAATVPGTVLTTMVNRGIYPNPYYGLNNLTIPESLNKQDYWYRTTFPTPAGTHVRQFTLTFEGINYRAKVWLNGHPLGSITGAFLRGVFPVTSDLRPPSQENVLAVRVDPPFHPGIPQEQSILGGPGQNGGMMELDGPTFLATEGWDWVPAIRDRDTGIWQPVVLHATGAVRIGDPQVITTLPNLPSRTLADVRINVPLVNDSNINVRATIHASFEGVSIQKPVVLAPGSTSITFTPAEFPQLAVLNPRLWWPNGYGKPNLYHLTLTAAIGREVSDTKHLHFGIREVSYVLGLMTPDGQLRQFIYDPSRSDVAATPIINVTHRGILQVPPQSPYPDFYPPQQHKEWNQWVESVTPAGMHSAALRPAPASYAGTRTFLVIMVNGVRIAARGGNWGMDDAMKNVSRAHLEPYFQLEQRAGVDMIRNWMGQSTEKTFYDLADKYGIMVWNGFWESTEQYNVEAEDPALFLKNARDVVLRYRNHPSIVLWCGRNEGVPQPILNRGLDKLIRTFDGTRYYTGSSNQVNLQVSGPYSWQKPALYYTNLNRGFSVETGSPSMPTLEAFKAWIPKPDQWPIDDVWAYHDWHQSGGGDTHDFMAAIQRRFGAPTSLADFERKAQMLNYIDYRAIFEGMDAHLWQPNSGRLLWMDHPAWPSTVWQIYSYDYSAQASYYGVKEALQPLHVQLDLSNGNIQVVNTTLRSYPSLTVAVHAWSLTNQQIFQKVSQTVSPYDQSVKAFSINLPQIESRGIAFIELTLTSSSGKQISRNLYWLAAQAADYRALDHLPQAGVTAAASWRKPTSGSDGFDQVRVVLRNSGTDVVLQQKLTLVDASGHRILPAYYSNNYVSLLPGEIAIVTIDYPPTASSSAPHLTLRAWNLTQRTIPVSEH